MTRTISGRPKTAGTILKMGKRAGHWRCAVEASVPVRTTGSRHACVAARHARLATGAPPKGHGAARVLPLPSSRLPPPGSRLRLSPPPDSTRRLQLLIVGALAGVVILLGGVGIGLALRSPAVSATGEPRPAAQPSDRAQNSRPPAAPVRTTPTTDDLAGQKPDVAVQPVPPAIESGGTTLPDVGSEPKDMVGDVDPDGTASPTTPDSALRSSVAAGKKEATQDAVTTLYQVIDIHRRPAWGIEGMMMTQELCIARS